MPADSHLQLSPVRSWAAQNFTVSALGFAVLRARRQGVRRGLRAKRMQAGRRPAQALKA
jgi:hypothetical protein